MNAYHSTHTCHNEELPIWLRRVQGESHSIDKSTSKKQDYIAILKNAVRMVFHE
jgi:hypothetical protein